MRCLLILRMQRRVELLLLCCLRILMELAGVYGMLRFVKRLLGVFSLLRFYSAERNCLLILVKLVAWLVTGSVSVMAIAMIVEPLLLIAGRKKLITRLQRQLRAERATP